MAGEQIEGLPEGATVRPIQTPPAATTQQVEGLPEGAIVKPLSNPPVAAPKGMIDQMSDAAVTPEQKISVGAIKAGRGLYHGVMGDEESDVSRGKTSEASPVAENLGFTSEHMGHAAGSMVHDVGKFLGGAAKDLASNMPVVSPNEPGAVWNDPKANTLFSKYVEAPSVTERQEALKEAEKFHQTHGWEAFGHLLNNYIHTAGEDVPFVGPFAAQLIKKAQGGDVGGAMAQVAALAAGEKAQHAVTGELKAGVSKSLDSAKETPELTQAKANVDALAKDREVAQKKYDAALTEHNKHAASHAQGVDSPAPVKKALEKAAGELDEAKFHHEAAVEATKKVQEAQPTLTQSAGTALGKAVSKVMPKQEAPAEVPAEKIEAAPVLQKLGQSKPAAPPINIKTPGQVQPETFPQEPTEVPRTSLGRINLANNQGTVGTPRQLTEGTPEGPKLPEGGLPKIKPVQEVLPPEKPIKPERGNLKALTVDETGKIVDKENTPEMRLQKLLEESLNNNQTKKAAQTPEIKAELPREETKEATKEAPAVEKEKAKPSLPSEEITGYTPKKEETVKTGEEGRENPKNAAEYHPAVQEQVTNLSDENLRKLAKAHGLNPDEYDFKARDEGRHRVERNQLIDEIMTHIGDDEKVNLGRLSEDLEHNPDMANKAKADRAAKVFPRLRGPVDEFGNPKVSGGSQGATTVGTEEGAKSDTEHFANAKKELGENASISDVAKRAQEMKDAAKPVDLKKIMGEYNKSEGFGEVKDNKLDVDPRRKEIAQAYDDMKHDPSTPEVKNSYDALIKDAKKQWNTLEKAGIKIEPTDEDPYKSYEDMKKDFSENKRLKVFRGGNELPEDHPLAQTDPKTGETYNVMFRAVHDAIGHLLHDNDFSEKGEENAFDTHRQTMSKEAVPAMTTETKAQVASFFDRDNKFPEQKAGILPKQFSEDAANKPRVAANIGEWKAPPELGAFSAEDVGAKVRAKNPEPTGRNGGEERRSVPREAQKESDKLFSEARKELGEDASSEDIQKRAEELKARPKATMETANMSEDELLKKGFTREDIENGRHLPAVSGGATGKLPTGDQLIKKYGESDDPGQIAFLLKDGRGVKQTGTLHDVMLGGKPTDNLREDFIKNQGAIRMRKTGAYGDRQISMSFPESGISEAQLQQLQKYVPQMATGKVYMEVAKPEGAYKVVDVPAKDFKDTFEKSLRELVPVLNEKGSPVDEFGNPTISGGSQTAAGTAKTKALPKLAEEHLTEEEKEGVTKSEAGRKAFVENLKKLPSVQEFTDIAKAGEGGRKWYQRSASAFDSLVEEAPKYFKDGDRQKFTDFLASLSPQQSVKMNLGEALNAWTRYVDEGRPVGKELEKLLKDEVTLPGAKVPNAMKALAGEPLWPDLSKNSNFKVPSFAKNLNGYLNHVTNDGWQALFGGLEAKQISRANSYHPLAVVTRAAADALGWEPAEAQAAIWAFTKTFTEKGETDPQSIRRYSEDFADILAMDPEIRQQLARLGVNHEQLDAKLRAIGKKPPVTPGASPTTENSVRKLAGRIEGARGKGTIPPPKSGTLNFEPDEEVEFDPEKFRTQTVEPLEKFGRKKSPLGRIK